VDARRPAATLRGRTIPTTLLLALAVVLAACGGAATPTPVASPAATASPAASATVAATQSPSPVAAFPLTLTDDEGTSVTIPAEPQHIVSLTPAATETLFALGLGDRVVGKVEDFSVYPPEAANVPDLAKFGSVDVEQIVAKDADLVIAGGSNFNPPESIQKLRSLGVPTVVVFAPDLAGAQKDIELIGQAVGKPDEAAAITADIRAAVDEVKAATSGATKPRVFYELDATNGFFGPAPDYFGTEMIEIAGGEPLTSGQDGVYQIEAEKILEFDPEIVLLGDAAYGVTPDQVAARPGWDVMTAVKDGAIRPIDDVVVTRPGPRLGDGLRALALAIHPGLALPGASASASAPAAASASPSASSSTAP
jgi:iron complex transport system substrate-binding protein